MRTARPKPRRLSLVFGLVAARALERGAEDIAQRRSGIVGTVLRDGLFLLGDFERLDRHRDLAALAVVLGDARIDLLSDLETVGALVVAVAGEIGAADERLELVANELHVDTVLLHGGNLTGDDIALLQVGTALRSGSRGALAALLELLDAERDTLLLDIHVENGRLDLVTLLVLL